MLSKGKLLFVSGDLQKLESSAGFHLMAASDWLVVIISTLPCSLTGSRGKYFRVVGILLMVEKRRRYLKFASHFKIISATTNKTLFENIIDLPGACAGTRNCEHPANLRWHIGLPHGIHHTKRYCHLCAFMGRS